MLIKLIIISVVLVALSILGLGVKLLFKSDAEFPFHSCTFEDGHSDQNGICSNCQLKELADCAEKNN
jgi:hypothetical protein